MIWPGMFRASRASSADSGSLRDVRNGQVFVCLASRSYSHGAQGLDSSMQSDCCSISFTWLSAPPAAGHGRPFTAKSDSCTAITISANLPAHTSLTPNLLPVSSHSPHTYLPLARFCLISILSLSLPYFPSQLPASGAITLQT